MIRLLKTRIQLYELHRHSPYAPVVNSTRKQQGVMRATPFDVCMRRQPQPTLLAVHSLTNILKVTHGANWMALWQCCMQREDKIIIDNHKEPTIGRCNLSLLTVRFLACLFPKLRVHKLEQELKGRSLFPNSILVAVNVSLSLTHRRELSLENFIPFEKRKRCTKRKYFVV